MNPPHVRGCVANHTQFHTGHFAPSGARLPPAIIFTRAVPRPSSPQVLLHPLYKVFTLPLPRRGPTSEGSRPRIAARPRQPRTRPFPPHAALGFDTHAPLLCRPPLPPSRPRNIHSILAGLSRASPLLCVSASALCGLHALCRLLGRGLGSGRHRHAHVYAGAAQSQEDDHKRDANGGDDETRQGSVGCWRGSSVRGLYIPAQAKPNQAKLSEHRQRHWLTAVR